MKAILSCALPAVMLLGCSEAEIKEAAKDAAAATKRHAEKAAEAAKVAKRRAGEAVEVAKDAGASTKEHAEDAVEAAKLRTQRAREWVAQNQPTGELSDETKRLLSTADARIAATVLEGKQLSPVALQLAETAYGSQAADFHVEAVYQATGSGTQRERINAQIAEMPRVETIDGLLVGFEELPDPKAKAATQGESSAFLVVWVQGAHLAGFVYSADETVDIEQLVAVMPAVLAKAKALL